jgi:hypothetical protein
MRLLGARQVYEEGQLAGKGISATGAASLRTARKTSLLTRAYRGLKTAAKYAFGAIAIGGVFALRSAVDATANLAKTTIGLQRNLGLTANEASRWGAVAESREINTKALTTTFAVLSSKMVEAARKGGALLTPFRQLGIRQAEVTKGSHNFQWGLLRVAKALGDAKGGAQRLTAAKALMGKGFQSVLPLFSEGVKGLKEQLYWSDKYHVTLNGKTTKSVMEFVQAQRESKVAMLGLKVSLATALMPALKDGEDQLQKFIFTLNDPKLSAEQKITRIGKQFERLEDMLIQVITKALPKVAESGGTLGVKLAGAVVKGFLHSGIWGKLVIGAWIFKFLGGFGLLRIIGARMAVALGTMFLETVAPYFAAEAGVEGIGAALSSRMGALKGLFRSKGRILGTAMGTVAGVALVAEIVFAVENAENIAGLSLFKTPKIGSTSIEEEAQYLTGLGYTGISFSSGKSLVAVTPSGKHVTETLEGGKWVEHATGGKHSNRHPGSERGSSKRPSARRQQTARERPIVIHNKTYLDGKLVAANTLHHAEEAAALA